MREMRATLPGAKQETKEKKRKKKKKGESKRLEAATTFVERLGPCESKLLRHDENNSCPHYTNTHTHHLLQSQQHPEHSIAHTSLHWTETYSQETHLHTTLTTTNPDYAQ